ncbi:putative RNA polymerase II subunit B1 CTD phosphatase RPAP2 isoform X2 [Belonocnema kinseyi]|nr:putative RNA polymerase II subunit B1 CTD phosphatase RPAP2 isoform X2 [Belonocnema kinseyi]
MQLAILKKKECDAKAHSIVEKLLEPDVDPQWLLESLEYINKCHMEDVIEERSIEKLCGYALCNKPLTTVVTQRYHISTKRNKVYDVSRRKCFCSSFCYGATNYLLDQMHVSPLWLREEDQVTEFHFLPDTHKTVANIPGEEVIVSGDDSITKADIETDDPESSEVKEPLKNDNLSKPELNEEKTIEEKNLESEKGTEKPRKLLEESESHPIANPDENVIQVKNSDNTKKIILEIAETRKSKKKCVTFQLPDDKESSSTSYQSPEKTEEVSKTLTTSDYLMKDITQKEDLDSSIVPVSQNPRRESIFQRERKSAKKTSRGSKNTLVTLGTLVKRIEEIFKEWITEETLRLLLGEETTKQQVFENVTKQEKYAALCKKLNQLQLEDEREERAKLEKTVSKAVPHYSFLQEDGKKLQLKVRAFYEGRTVIEIPDESDKNEDAEKVEDSSPVFPLTESRAPKAIRRRIFLEKINNILPDLLRALSGNGQVLPERFAYSRERVTAVKALVSTFALNANNIVFKSAEWTLVGLIIIKMMSAMDPGLKYLFATKQASLYTSMILMSYQLDSNYLDTFINSLTNEMPCRLDESTT